MTTTTTWTTTTQTKTTRTKKKTTTTTTKITTTIRTVDGVDEVIELRAEQVRSAAAGARRPVGGDVPQDDDAGTAGREDGLEDDGEDDREGR